MKVLELFAGTKSIGKAFEERGHEVYSIEWDKRFEGISLYADIMTVQYDQILDAFGRPDVIWASPDCTTYSIAAISHHRKQDDHGNLVPALKDSSAVLKGRGYRGNYVNTSCKYARKK